MTTITHRHSRPHHNDEPEAFFRLDVEAKESAGDVIATATSAEYRTNTAEHDDTADAVAASERRSLIEAAQRPLRH